MQQLSSTLSENIPEVKVFFGSSNCVNVSFLKPLSVNGFRIACAVSARSPEHYHVHVYNVYGSVYKYIHVHTCR